MGYSVLLGEENPKRYFMRNQYYAYIITNKNNRVLYTGITNDLRIVEKQNFIISPLPNPLLKGEGEIGNPKAKPRGIR